MKNGSNLWNLPDDGVFIFMNMGFNEKLLTKIKSKFEFYNKFYAHGKTEERILNTLRNNPLTINDVPDKPDRSHYAVEFYLTRLRKEQKIESFEHVNGIKIRAI